MIGTIELGLFVDGLIFVYGDPDLFHELRLERVVLVRDCALYLREPRNRVQGAHFRRKQKVFASCAAFDLWTFTASSADEGRFEWPRVDLGQVQTQLRSGRLHLRFRRNLWLCAFDWRPARFNRLEIMDLCTINALEMVIYILLAALEIGITAQETLFAAAAERRRCLHFVRVASLGRKLSTLLISHPWYWHF